MKNAILGRYEWVLGLALAYSCLLSVTDAAVPQFQDGDRVAFVGDSITHGGSYHAHVYLYYLTRFPEREFRIWNKGISGEKASHVLHRFEEDVAVVKPNVSAVMLGMNDVGRWLYDPDKTDTATQQKYLDTHYSDVTQLLGKLDAIDSEVILITPTIYDQTAELERTNEVGVNDALGQCADFVKATAASRGLGYVDFYDAMSTINAQIQQDDPSASIVGPDRVHPNADFGHFIMGYQFLKAQAVPQLVSKIVLDAQSGALEVSENATVSGLMVSTDSVSFTALEGALPFPQTQSIAKALELVPFEAEMNQQILAVQNLAEGSYALAIDGEKIGTWSAAQLETGVNLAVMENTPQYQQALKVKQLNDARHYQQSRLRNAAYVFYSSGLSQAGIDLTDTQAVEAFLAEKLKESEGKTWYEYVKKQYGDYLTINAKKADIKTHLETLHSELYEANQPVPHRFTLTKVAADTFTEDDSEVLFFNGTDDYQKMGVGTIGALAKGEQLPAAPRHRFQLPSIFTDGMVLQRGQPARIWGRDIPGATVRVEFAGQTKTATADSSGQWELQLDPMPASSEGRSMTVTSQPSGFSLQVSNILVGDVWICSGQSNMEFPLFKSTHGEAALEQPANDSIRFFKQRFDGAPEPLFDCVEGHWKTDTPDGRKWISAVAWNFAQEIYASEQVPLAMVTAYIGGSSAQMWTPIEDLRADALYQYYVKQYDAYASNFETLKATYPTRKADAEAAGKPLSIMDHYGWFPSATYNAMLHPIQNFTTKGVIWYQGEANADPFQAKLYRKLFPAMIEAWRREFNEPDLPFLFVQLPNYKPWRETDWALLRESQALTAEQVPHTGMAVTIDIGDSDDVHPTLKKPVGERLAAIALNQVYGRDVVHAAPSYQSITVQGGSIAVHFDGPVRSKDGETIREFTICEQGQMFVPAKAVVSGNTVFVSSPEVPEPVAVRYAWSNNPQVNLFGVNGLPVAPFRTDTELSTDE